MRPIWKSLVGTVRGMIEDDCHGQATQIAYHWIFALFPGLFVLAAILSFLGESRGFLDTLEWMIERGTPGVTGDLVRSTLEAMARARDSGTAPVLGLGLVGVIWVASNGFAVIMGGLNRAYRVVECRPFWRRRLIAMLLVVAVGFGLLTAFQILVAGSSIVLSLLATLPEGHGVPALLGWARWPAYFVVAFAVAVALYSVAPCLPRVSWRWTAPGAFVFAGLWIVIGFLFDRYLALYGGMDKLYGTLGAFLALLGWLYLTAFAFLVGGELNGQVRWRHMEHPQVKRLPPRQRHVGDQDRGRVDRPVEHEVAADADDVLEHVERG